jgi:hypothetical protein
MVDFDNMQRWDSDGKWQTENARIYQQFMQRFFNPMGSCFRYLLGQVGVVVR